MTPPPKDSETNSAEHWLARARSNLVRAKQPKQEGVFWEDLCFDAQQAAEKALKALLIAKNKPFRRIHDIGELFICLNKAGVTLPDFAQEAAILTDYAVAARYPEAMEPVTQADYNKAIVWSEKVFDWVEQQLTNSAVRKD